VVGSKQQVASAKTNGKKAIHLATTASAKTNGKKAIHLATTVLLVGSYITTAATLSIRYITETNSFLIYGCYSMSVNFNPLLCNMLRVWTNLQITLHHMLLSLQATLQGDKKTLL
jgi:hypothetical protein